MSNRITEKDSLRIRILTATGRFTPQEIAQEIKKHISEFEIAYEPDFRQSIADSWPASINDKEAREDWGWEHRFDLENMVKEMIAHLPKKSYF